MILSFLLLLLNSSFLSDTTFLRVMLLSCLHCCPWVATINSSVAKSRILPAFVSAPAPRGKLRSCLPSLCARQAPVFALQGVPQLEGLSVCCRVGGWIGLVRLNRTNL